MRRYNAQNVTTRSSKVTTRTSLTGLGVNSTSVIMGGGSTASGVVVDVELMLFLATQVTLVSPSLTRKSKVETVSQRDIMVVVEVVVTLESSLSLILHSMVGRGFPER